MTHATASAIARQAVEAWAHVRSVVTPWELSYVQTLVWALTCEVEETWMGTDDRPAQTRFDGFDLASMFRSTWGYDAFDALLVKIDALQARGEPLGDLLAHALQVWPTLDDGDPTLIEQVTDAAKWLASITPRGMAGHSLSFRTDFNGQPHTVTFRESDRTLADIAARINEAWEGLVRAEVDRDGTLRMQFREAMHALVSSDAQAFDRLRREFVHDVTLALPDAPPPARHRHDDPPAHIGRRLDRRLRKGARR